MDIKWKEFSQVAAFGAIGGGLSLVYSLTVGNPPAIAPLPWGIFAYLILGAAAGLFGVYLIAKTDTRHAIHCLMFACACGLSWAPIFDATTALIENNKVRTLRAGITQQIEEVRAATTELRNSSEDKLPTAINSIVNKADKLLSAVSKANDWQLTVAAYSSVEKVDDSLNEISKRNPKLTFEARKDISKVLSKSKSGSAFDHPWVYENEWTTVAPEKKF